MTAPEIIVQTALDHMGCPYVYGTWGQTCTPALRKRYASYNPKQKAITYKRCPVLSDKQTKCTGCKYDGLLAFDCRGFTHFCCEKAGITIAGQAVGTQWSDKSNWTEKGDIAVMPDLVCCVFIRKSNGTWSHTGLHIGGGRIIHCSVEVKEDRIGGDRSWTHYAIPAGLYTDQEIKDAHKGGFMRILKKGSFGEDVKEMQEMLNKIGYSCGAADGKFGNNTEAAVIMFQRANGLTEDGIAGPQTLTLLAARAADPTQPELPEDDDKHHDPLCVVLTLDEAMKLRDCLRSALSMIEAKIT